MTNNFPDFSNREALLHANSALIGQLQARLKTKRWRPQEGENIKISYIRALIQALQTQNQILKDLDLEEVKRRLEALENSQSERVGASKTHNSSLGA